MKQLQDYTAAELRRIVSLKEQIEELQAELADISGAGNSEAELSTGKRTMSASARRKIALAQKARWAKQKGVSETKPTRKKRSMSAEARARIAAAAKARWAKVKAAGGSSL